MRTIALLLALAACSKPAPIAERVDAAPAPIAVASRAFARFTKGQLQQCIDVIGEGTSPKLERALSDEQPIGKPCAKAFADRITLALCTVELPTDAGVTKLVISHYDFADVGLSDVAMSECLSSEGSWNPISRDSAPFRKAKLEHAQRRLQKAAEGLQP